MGVTGIWSMKAETMEVMEEIDGGEIATLIVLATVEITETTMDMEGATQTGTTMTDMEGATPTGTTMPDMEGATPTGTTMTDMEGATKWATVGVIINASKFT